MEILKKPRRGLNEKVLLKIPAAKEGLRLRTALRPGGIGGAATAVYHLKKNSCYITSA
jgi:transaldolase